jgi:3-methyladenine DNA glycosylase AlkC
MAEPLKYVYNDDFFVGMTRAISKVEKGFNETLFLKDIHDAEWENRALKQRMRHISKTLNSHLSGSFKKQATTIVALIEKLIKGGANEMSFEYMFLPDFIEVYGLEDFETSVNAFEKITQFTSCEFGVRPFLLKYPSKMMAQMVAWSSHKHAMVRRLSTEGCRPMLPWAMGLPELKKDPTPILPILKKLRNDESESVRRSVANNLNDVSKNQPEIVIGFAKKWLGESAEVNWVVKHACRTLLKQGNMEVMPLFGFGSVEDIQVKDFQVLTPTVKIGEYFEFSFQLINTANLPLKLRLEYGLYYQKANGTLSRKVFKISEKEYAANSTTKVHRKQHFKIISTRKLHLGLHQVSLIINGVELERYDFELID